MYILDKCKYEISFYQRYIKDDYKDDFSQDVSYLILIILKNKNFKFYFYKNFKAYKSSILCNNFKNISFLYDFLEKKYNKNIYKNKEKIILTKDFYLKFKDFYFECMFLSYIRKTIKNQWILYSRSKYSLLSSALELTNSIINKIYTNDNFICLIAHISYLNDSEIKLLELYNRKTQVEIAKELHMSQQNISYRIKKIKKKLKNHE